jgi:hypothetical protein
VNGSPLQAASAERIPGGYVVKDATGQALAYVYARDTAADAQIAKVLTTDEARLIAISFLVHLHLSRDYRNQAPAGEFSF